MSRIFSAFRGTSSSGEQAPHIAAARWAESHGLETRYVDVEVLFVGASGLPNTDIVSKSDSDPYLVAKLDNNLSFVSAVRHNTLAPVWNERWRVKNVPSFANLHVDVMRKGNISDSCIGSCDATLTPGAKELTIGDSSKRRNRGSLWLVIRSTPSTDETATQQSYIFDGPVRYSRHFSPTVGRFAGIDNKRLYSAWRMYLRGVRPLFGDTEQPWDKQNKAAQAVFQGPASIAVCASVQAGHRVLYARSAETLFGIVENPADLFTQVLAEGKPGLPLSRRVKPSVYAYVISLDDDSLCFSETDATFFLDFASKHALHSNCATSVRYSGEFHPRPEGGWDKFSDDTLDDQTRWELVIDNSSETYSADPLMLPALKELFEFNFPGIEIHAWDRSDPRLAQSREACRAYASAKRGVHQGEMQPADYGQEPLALFAAQAAARTHAPNANRASDRYTEDEDIRLVLQYILTIDPSPATSSSRLSERLSVYKTAVETILHSNTPFMACISTLRDTGPDTLSDFIMCTMLQFRDGVLGSGERKIRKRTLMKYSNAVGAVPSVIFVGDVVCSDAEKMSPRGFGGFAEVFRGRRSEVQQEVALKRLRKAVYNDADQSDWRRPFFREALLWRQLRHPCILEFLGLDEITFEGCLCMISPWMGNGDIAHYLGSHSDVENSLRFKWIKDTMEGLAYLHQEHVIHGDLRGANILLDDELKAHITDFGLSMLMDAGISSVGFSTRREGAIRWMAPEVIRTGECDAKGDIYSFGCVCLEIMSGRIPLPDLRSDRQIFSGVVMDGIRPQWHESTEKGDKITAKLAQLAKRCWQTDPTNRPETQSIATQLRSLI